ncbi:MAG: hypothetical protein JWM28_1302 [Chitinophagaceae bacterium]|nr:hypothetical protein [Chitinophagaceae bacterium]
MMKAFFISLLVLIVISCTSKQKIPQDILSQPTMQAVLWDLLRTDEFVLIYVRNDSLHNKKDESTRLYEEVFRMHQTNREQFKKSLIFYNGHPDLLKVVLDSLENKKSTILQDVHRKPMIPDSAHKKFKLSETR